MSATMPRAAPNQRAPVALVLTGMLSLAGIGFLGGAIAKYYGVQRQNRFTEGTCHVTEITAIRKTHRNQTVGWNTNVHLALEAHDVLLGEVLVGGDNGTEDDALVLGRKLYPVGSQVTCFYDPGASSPQWMTLERVQKDSWKGMAGFAAFWCASTWGLFAWSIVRQRRQTNSG
jgi:hypothetical protein